MPFERSTPATMDGILLVCCLVVCGGCGSRKAQDVEQAPAVAAKGNADTQVVARVGETVLTQQDIDAELERLPRALRLRFSSKERQADLLQRVVDLELLAQEARRAGLDRDPQVVDRVRHGLVSQVAREIVGEAQSTQSISDDELSRYYHANAGRYRRPATADAPAVLPPLSELRGRVWNDLVRQRRLEALRGYVRQLRARAKIERLDQSSDSAAGAATSDESRATKPGDSRRVPGDAGRL